MCNWLKKLFGCKCHAGHCGSCGSCGCKQEDSKAVKPESGKIEDTQKTQ